MTEIYFPLDGVTYPSRIDANTAYAQGHWMGMTVGDLVRKQAHSLSGKMFVVTDNSTMSYAQFDKHTEILAASLIDLGLHPGDRAIFQMGTVPETLIALFACYKAGIIPVCTLPQHRESEISTMIHLTKPRAYFVQADFDLRFDLVNFARTIAKKNGYVQHIIATRGVSSETHSLEQLSSQMSLDKARTRLSDIKIGSGDVLTFQLSGGSTNIPKIIPRFHGEYLGQANSIVERYHFTETEVAIWSLPLIHNAAMLMIVLPILLSGGTIVLQQRFEIQKFLCAIKRYSVTFAGSIGPVAARLLECNVPNSDLRSLRMFFALDRADAIEDHLKITTVNLYGITEGLLMTCSPDDPSTMRFKMTGYPCCSSDQIRVLRPETEQSVSEGVEGELCFRGPHTLCGYYNAPTTNAESFTSDGFFRSGDLVRSEYYNGRITYTFLGRLKDNISRGGEKFAAEEVERLLVLHPAIADAKVVAMPDRYLGEKACAFIMLQSGRQCPTVDALGVFLSKQGLARYKHPERIEIVEVFPLTKVGKVDKVAMRQLINSMIAANDQAGCDDVGIQGRRSPMMRDIQ